MKLFISEKVPSLNRLSRARKMEKISFLTLFSVRAILSRVYVQLDVRPVEEGYREVVCSWKSSELESAEPCEEKYQKSRSQPNSVFAQFSVVCMFNWMFGQLRKVIGRSYVRGRAPNLNRLSRARKNIKNLALSLI